MRLTILGSLALGLAIGACATSALSADGRPPPKAYVVAEINVKDVAAYREYVEGAPPSERVMIIEFASLDRAKAFEYSKEYTDIAPLRRESAESRLFIVEGTDDVAASRP